MDGVVESVSRVYPSRQCLLPRLARRRKKGAPMTRRAFGRLCRTAGMLLMTAAAVQAQTRDTPRLPWGDPDLEGTWTNATLTQLQRPADLGAKAFFTPEEAAAWDKQRIEQTNADRPARPGEVGAYNDAFFERGRGGVKSRRTSLVIDPPDGRIPALTPL